jgi:hypothetical protein
MAQNFGERWTETRSETETNREMCMRNLIAGGAFFSILIDRSPFDNAG